MARCIDADKLLMKLREKCPGTEGAIAALIVHKMPDCGEPVVHGEWHGIEADGYDDQGNWIYDLWE